jgi:DNA (cytosine-5)-methyltransferase 1
MKHGSLFSGIGGFDLAAERVGWSNEFHCEIKPYCLQVLKEHFPNSISYDDITRTDFSQWRNKIDIITGGVPCQPFSKAGKMLGEKDERYLWDDYIRVIRECKPRWFVAENVSGLLTTNNGDAYEQIMLQLETEGYETLTIGLPACAVGAYHIRERIWIIGRAKVESDTNTTGRQLGEIPNESQEEGTQHSTQLSGDPFGLHWYEAISRIHGVFNGISRKLDASRNTALGNAIVPQVAQVIFETINKIDKVYGK